MSSYSRSQKIDYVRKRSDRLHCIISHLSRLDELENEMPGSVKSFDEYLQKLQNETELLVLSTREMSFESGSLPPLEVNDSITDAFVQEGYGVEFTKQGYLRAVLPPLINRRSQMSGAGIKVLTHTLKTIFHSFYLAHEQDDLLKKIFQDSVVVYKFISERKSANRDYDNLERKSVLDALKADFLADDCMKIIDVFECYQTGDSNYLVLYVIPKNSFHCFVNDFWNAPECKFDCMHKD